MTEQEQKDFEWASSYYLYDYLDADCVNCDEEKLKWLLERAFYKVSNNIFENIKNNRTSEIYNSYISFIDY